MRGFVIRSFFTLSVVKSGPVTQLVFFLTLKTKTNLLTSVYMWHSVNAFEFDSEFSEFYHYL